MWVAFNYLDSLGLHDLVRRCLDYYFEKQRDDGFIQTFIGYMLENGSVLLALGEHYRYTRDAAWLTADCAEDIENRRVYFRLPGQRRRRKASVSGFCGARSRIRWTMNRITCSTPMPRRD